MWQLGNWLRDRTWVTNSGGGEQRRRQLSRTGGLGGGEEESYGREREKK